MEKIYAITYESLTKKLAGEKDIIVTGNFTIQADHSQHVVASNIATGRTLMISKYRIKEKRYVGKLDKSAISVQNTGMNTKRIILTGTVMEIGQQFDKYALHAYMKDSSVDARLVTSREISDKKLEAVFELFSDDEEKLRKVLGEE